MNETRLKNLRSILTSHNLDAYLVSKPSSLRYLLGFTGSSGLGFLTGESVTFITDFRYEDQAAQEIHADTTVIAKKSLFESLPAIPQIGSVQKVGFEPEHLTFDNYRKVTDILDGITFIPLTEEIEKIAAIKSFDEIKNIQKASAITIRVYHEILGLLNEGVSESDIAAEITFRIRKNGGDGVAFEPIVLFGEHSALPHGTPGVKQLGHGDSIQLDFGAVYNGYCSDFSRVVVLGKADKEFLKVYSIVNSALDRALSVVRAGIEAKAIDFAARSFIKKNGYGNNFRHALGHGVGLTVHAFPKISSAVSDPVETMQIFTIEPGIYIPGRFGIRIEELVMIGNEGVTNLTDVPRELIVL